MSGLPCSPFRRLFSERNLWFSACSSLTCEFNFSMRFSNISTVWRTVRAAILEGSMVCTTIGYRGVRGWFLRHVQYSMTFCASCSPFYFFLLPRIIEPIPIKFARPMVLHFLPYFSSCNYWQNSDHLPLVLLVRKSNRTAIAIRAGVVKNDVPRNRVSATNRVSKFLRSYLGLL